MVGKSGKIRHSLLKYEHNKESGAFIRGAAIITGKIWRGPKVGYYLTGIDFDNRVAIEQFLSKCKAHEEDKTPTLQELSEYILLEQHLDDPDKLHAYVCSRHPFKNKGSDKGKPWFKIETMPAIEVKGSKSLMFCSPSMHKGGHRYEFLNEDKTMLPPVTDKLEGVINEILQAHGIEYLTKDDKKTRSFLGDADNKKTVTEGSRHTTLLTKMNAMLHDFIRAKPLEQIKTMCMEFNNLYCNPPLPTDEFERMWIDSQVHVIEEEREKDAATTGSGGIVVEGIVSVETTKRLDSGCYAVKGMVIQVSIVIQMITSTDFRCNNCNKTDTHNYNPPLFSVPSGMQVGEARRDECLSCGERYTFEVVKHTMVPAMKIQLQDERKQNAIEGLDVVLFGTDTINVRTGENCMVFGELHVVESRKVLITHLFANTKGGAIEYEKPETKDIVLTEEDLKELNEFQSKPDMKQKLVEQFAPTIINHDSKKLAIILQYIGAPETEHFTGYYIFQTLTLQVRKKIFLPLPTSFASFTSFTSLARLKQKGRLLA